MALKLDLLAGRPFMGGRKQERRSGIETRAGRAVRWRSGTKQERRSGIETTISVNLAHLVAHEAGTPWWH